MDIMHELRDATQEMHRRLEELPLAQALVQGRVGRRAYAALLRQLVHFHAAAEKAFAAHPELGVHRPHMDRRGILARDLRTLGAETAASALPAVVEFGDQLDEWSAVSPPALLGCLYVLEGSRLGSLHLIKPIAAALGVAPLPGHGLDYHLDGSAQRPQLWQQFQQNLRAAVSDAAMQPVVVHGAQATFAALYELYAALPAHDEAAVPRTGAVALPV